MSFLGSPILSTLHLWDSRRSLFLSDACATTFSRVVECFWLSSVPLVASVGPAGVGPVPG